MGQISFVICRGDLFCAVVDQRPIGANTAWETFKLVRQPSKWRVTSEGEGAKLPQLH